MISDEIQASPAADQLRQAMHLHRTGQTESSYHRLRAILQAFPGDFETLHWTGFVASRLGRVREAREHFSRALEINPRDLDYRVNLVGFCLAQGDLHSALEMVVAGGKLHPGNSTLEALRLDLRRRVKLRRIPLTVVSPADLVKLETAQRAAHPEYAFARNLSAALEDAGAHLGGEVKDLKAVLSLHPLVIPEDDSPHFNLAWVRGQPDLVTPDHLRRFDHLFCQSPKFADQLRQKGFPVEVLIGATGFRPPALPAPPNGDLVLVADHQPGTVRKVIQDLKYLGVRWLKHLKVYGAGWEEILPPECLGGPVHRYADLAQIYTGARAVLCDHPLDMRRWGFAGSGLLDVLGSGGAAICDDLAGAAELFGGALATYRTPRDLDRLLTAVFEDEAYREGLVEAGLKAVEPYRIEAAARQIVLRLAEVDEAWLDRRFKNRYMEKVWAPETGQLHTARVRHLKLVTAEECVGITLDVGCANGDSTAIMQQHRPALHLTGLELTDWGCREAARRHPDLRFVQGTASHLPFADRSFDTVVLDHVIEHVVDPVPLILEAKRVARRRVVVGLPLMHLNDPDHRIAWSLDDFRNLMKGFFPRVQVRGMREPDGVEVFDESQFNFAVASGCFDGGNRKEISWTGPLRLNLGCGTRQREGCLNLDLVPSPAVDLACDSRRLPFPAGSVSGIECYHMIEHLPRYDCLKALYEWNRVLEEGGELVIECPDFDAAVRDYVAGKRYRINNIFGLQRHPGDFHHFGYSFELLKEYLEGVGFGLVRREPPTDYHTAEEPCLRLTAVKLMEVPLPPNLERELIDRTVRQFRRDLQADRNEPSVA
ncbi:MAG: methyltransferase domain-containing protein [Candidatus Zixiibacteriota bacterium]|nr:MAG: methyltransferase domain-containing protein [candidate division Zixibacteria bacterium]